jgi:hypothetical protein
MIYSIILLPTNKHLISKLRYRFFSLYIRLKNNYTSNKDKFSNITIGYNKLYNRII